jgi:GNAT superfamily N-acetyltransferase
MQPSGMSAELTLRSLQRDEWPEAMTLAARAFLGEPFVIGMFGAEPILRFASAHRFYQSSTWYDDEEHLAAYVGDVLVGLCLTSSAGRCHICTRIDPDRPPEEPLAVVDWQFEVDVKAAHADQGTHAWLSRVVVDPALHGAGIGRSLIGKAVARLASDGAPSALLECQPHREDFYVACGFHRAGSVRDPTGPDACLMRIDLGRTE